MTSDDLIIYWLINKQQKEIRQLRDHRVQTDRRTSLKINAELKACDQNKLT